MQGLLYTSLLAIVKLKERNAISCAGLAKSEASPSSAQGPPEFDVSGADDNIRLTSSLPTMAKKLATLEKLLGDLPDPAELPHPLPLTHMSVAKWFAAIAGKGELSTTMCSVFGSERLYFFYGGVYYRPHDGTTRNHEACPVAFVFSPKLLSCIERIFPFDTGAVHSNRFKGWKRKLWPEHRFGVPMGPKIVEKLVHYSFGDNSNYVDACPMNNHGVDEEPYPRLHEFYSEDFSSGGGDRRQISIECQAANPVPLNEDLLWVGFPEALMPEFAKICEWTHPLVPDYHAYRSATIVSPAQIAAVLADKARTDVLSRYEM